MRSVADIYQDCLSNADQQAPLDLLLLDAVGCVLAEDVVAIADYPASNVASRDGYALRAGDVAMATALTHVELPVTGEIRAGQAHAGGLAPNTAVRIASGAPLPIGADAVVALTDTDQGESQVSVNVGVDVGDNVRLQGEDIKQGSVVVPKRTRLGPPQIGAIAAAGRARVLVHPRPRVVILSVGDELVEPGSAPREGSVVDINGQALVASASEVGAETFHAVAVGDDRAALRQMIDDQLMRADLIVTTGGLSHGSGNTVRETLRPHGTVRFDTVSGQPGAMLGVGTVSVEGDEATATPIFCLPGDPVAAQVCFEVFVRPALRKMQGWKTLNRSSVKARATFALQSPAGIREFLRVRIQGSPSSGYEAHALGDPKALWISALASSNALAVIPEETTSVPEGTLLTCMLLD